MLQRLGADDGYTPGGRFLRSETGWVLAGRSGLRNGVDRRDWFISLSEFTGHLVVQSDDAFLPGSGKLPADDGIEAAAHHGRAHVHMNDEAADGCEGTMTWTAMAR